MTNNDIVGTGKKWSPIIEPKIKRITPQWQRIPIGKRMVIELL